MTHSFWEADTEDHRGRKMTLNVHAVGLDPGDPKAIEDHLRAHGFKKHKKIEVKPAEGLINFHRYPVKRVLATGDEAAPESRKFHTPDGHIVDLNTGQLLGPDGEPIEISDEDMLMPVEHPNPAKKLQGEVERPNPIKKPQVDNA